MNNLQPGQMLGAYRIINQIGQGGMAAVYKAYQPSMDRNVAIKILPSQLAESKEFATRFQQEAHIIARLEHPHILPVIDYGESDGITYFVMRYLEAGTLKTKMESGPLRLNEIDRIFTQLADALGYAHGHGVIHRDLKPANVLVDSQGNLFLTDFGIAKLLESSSPRLTQTDAIMGTPAYISPEQAQAQDVDQRSDIYSLGIILYEMVTGRVPFVADTPLAVILKHVTDPLPLPTSIKPDIPEAIQQVILKALAKNPGDRFATAAEFASAWKRALDEKDSGKRVTDLPTAISAHPETSNTRTQPMPTLAATGAAKPGKFKTWIAGCTVAACLLLSVVGVVFLTLNRKNIPFLNPSLAAATLPSDGSTPAVNSGPKVGNTFEITVGDEISNGVPGPGAGMIEAAGSKDVYTFTANANQNIYVHIIEAPTSGGTIGLSMVDDLGANIFNSCLQCGDPGAMTLERGGKYTLTVGNDDPNGAGTGAYRIKIWDLPPPDQFPINLNDEISRDVPGKGAGNIENPGWKDIYTFTADAGQAVYFQVKQPPQTSDTINWRAEDDQGNEIFNSCLQCGDPGLITLDRGGTYRVIVGNTSGAGTGAYALKIWSVPPPDEFTIKIGDPISSGVPGKGAGVIETAGAHDIYTFSANAGQIVSFAVKQQLKNNETVEWRLVDEQGKEIFNTCLACGDPGTITLEGGGTYTLTVGSNTNPGTGTYELQVAPP